jgi:cytochrome oxidase assembly protein ShyY1
MARNGHHRQDRSASGKVRPGERPRKDERYRRAVSSFRFVFTPKWMAFHALTWIILVPAFIGLGQWQRDLWRDRADSQGIVLRALAAKPVALGSVDPAGHDVAQSQQFTMVEATGHYDTAHQFMVPNRSQNENPGWYVVTPLVLANGTAVLVNQGWVTEQSSGGPTVHPPFPPVPSGTVTVIGSLQPDETTSTTRITDDTRNLPTDEIALVSKVDAADRVPYQLYDGAIQLDSSTPANTAAAAAQPIPNPSYDNTMYIAYMIQWWAFAIIMPITWLKLIFRERGEREIAELEALAADVGDDDEDDDELLGEDDEEDAEELTLDDDDEADDDEAAEPEPEPSLVPAQAVEQGGEAFGREEVERLPGAVRR